MKLQTQLDNYKQTSRQRLAPEKGQILEDHVRHLRLSEQFSSVAGVGSKAPDFALNNHEGKPWWLRQALRSGPLVLKFYRGTWCPYCNIELRAYHLRLAMIRERGASFVAVSPEKPDFAQAFITKEQIEFPVLSDLGNLVARQFGLEFEVDARLRQLMKEFGNDLVEKNGENGWKLPVPGTFVISKNGYIQYSFVEPDFTLRADPDDVIAVLDKLHGESF
jgi:peroxiredoxin